MPTYCDPNCYNKPLPPVANCDAGRRRGGFKRIIVASCLVSFTDITDLSEWCAHLANGDLVMSPPVHADKPMGSATKARIQGCAPETTTGFTRMVNFRDFRADNTTFSDYAFYNDILINAPDYQFGFISCDGSFIGLISDVSVEVDIIYPESATEFARWEGNLSWEGMAMPVPILIPGLEQALATNCAP